MEQNQDMMIGEDDNVRKEIRRSQNSVAAKRYRQKRKREMEQIKDENDYLRLDQERSKLIIGQLTEAIETAGGTVPEMPSEFDPEVVRSKVPSRVQDPDMLTSSSTNYTPPAGQLIDLPIDSIMRRDLLEVESRVKQALSDMGMDISARLQPSVAHVKKRLGGSTEPANPAPAGVAM